MKYRLFIAAVVLVFYAFGRDDGLRNVVPAMSDLGQGTLTEAGSRDAFEKATGIPLPESVKPKLGTFRVWNEKDYAGRNRSFHTAKFVAPPEEVLALADAIELKWKAAYGANPDVQIVRKKAGPDLVYTAGGEEFGPGSIALLIYNPYVVYSELNAHIDLDPASGKMHLASYRGTEDDPSDRLVDERRRREEEERDAKSQAEADASGVQDGSRNETGDHSL